MARMASMVRLPLLASALLVGLACAKDNTLARTPPMVRPRCSAPSPAAEAPAPQPVQQQLPARRAALSQARMLAPARGAVT